MTGWTRGAMAAATLVGLSGCVAAMRLASVESRFSQTGRPESSYYCYDCHGNRYFDPYYDSCANYGFRYSWARHPEAVRIYRQRYPRIRESHPEYGRYRYRDDYRASRRYREPRDYEAWRRAQAAPAKEGSEVREKRRGDSERDEKRMKGRERRDPGERRHDSLREGD